MRKEAPARGWRQKKRCRGEWGEGDVEGGGNEGGALGRLSEEEGKRQGSTFFARCCDAAPRPPDSPCCSTVVFSAGAWPASLGRMARCAPLPHRSDLSEDAMRARRFLAPVNLHPLRSLRPHYLPSYRSKVVVFWIPSRLPHTTEACAVAGRRGQLLTLPRKHFLLFRGRYLR